MLYNSAMSACVRCAYMYIHACMSGRSKTVNPRILSHLLIINVFFFYFFKLFEIKTFLETFTKKPQSFQKLLNSHKKKKKNLCTALYMLSKFVPSVLAKTSRFLHSFIITGYLVFMNSHNGGVIIKRT